MNCTVETVTPNEKLTSLVGVLIPVDWDDDGGITSVALSTADEGRYLVVNDEKGKQMISLVRAKLKLTGRVKTVDNETFITVVKFQKKSDWD